ncbi:MAG TPA: hypothetical protein VF173_01280 [Thermoanaerobaculia bacterium]|nr:hypothetical protein [Thermoanaerobaculia bacterium]
MKSLYPQMILLIGLALLSTGGSHGSDSLSLLAPMSAAADEPCNAPPAPLNFCARRNKDCGCIDDGKGMGGKVNCGTCTAPDTCGGSGKDNVCGCDLHQGCCGPFRSQIVRNTAATGNTVSVSCPTGLKVLGGGCSDDSTGTRLHSSAPQGDSSWSCSFERNPGSLTAWAECAALPADGCKGYQIFSGTLIKGDFAAISCRGDNIVLGGGCRDDTNNAVLVSSFPTANQAWVCTWQSGNGHFTAFAICGKSINHVQVNSKTERMNNVASVQCPAGKKIVSGGCSGRDDLVNSAAAETSQPWNDNGWTCTWAANPGSLTVYAICEDP